MILYTVINIGVAILVISSKMKAFLRKYQLERKNDYWLYRSKTS